ncbi:MAG: hypothetical protein KIH44_014145 [Octadecabacter sp.]|nr:hypothetical protein [Octadecabacter sp.]
MKLLLKTVAFGAIAAALTACSGVDTVTRNVPLETPRIGAIAQADVLRDYSLHSVRFAAPADMRVSEANSYYPIADVVWRGDPLGNRLGQISAIFQTSIQAAGDTLTGAKPVIVDVELVRFHSLTERTRYSIGGVHSIKFDLTVRDAETGEVLEATRRIDGDLAALGGSAALAADNAGQGQKVRITAHLTQLFTHELTGLSNAAENVQAGS